MVKTKAKAKTATKAENRPAGIRAKPQRRPTQIHNISDIASSLHTMHILWQLNEHEAAKSWAQRCVKLCAKGNDILTDQLADVIRNRFIDSVEEDVDNLNVDNLECEEKIE